MSENEPVMSPGDRAFIPREVFAAGLPELLPCEVTDVLEDGRVRVRIQQGSRVFRDVQVADLDGVTEVEFSSVRGGALRPPEGDEITEEMRERGRQEMAVAFEDEAPAGDATAGEREGRETETIDKGDVGELPPEILDQGATPSTS